MVDAYMDPRRSTKDYGRDNLYRRSAAGTLHLPNSGRIRNMPDQVQPSHGHPTPPVLYPSATQVPSPCAFQVPYPGTSVNSSNDQQTFSIANSHKRTPSPTSIHADPVSSTNNEKVIWFGVSCQEMPRPMCAFRYRYIAYVAEALVARGTHILACEFMYAASKSEMRVVDIGMQTVFHPCALHCIARIARMALIVRYWIRRGCRAFVRRSSLCRHM